MSHKLQSSVYVNGQRAEDQARAIEQFKDACRQAEQQGTPTPRTDAATAGVDFFITDSDQRAYSATDYECLRDEMKKLERELSSAQEQIAALREALGLVMTKLREENESDDPMYPFSFDASWEAAAMKADAALAATRKECEHGKGLTDYCQPCGRVNNG